MADMQDFQTCKLEGKLGFLFIFTLVLETPRGL